MRLLIATTNAGKVREFVQLLSGAGNDLQVESLAGHRQIVVAEETGRTFGENACQKASYYARELNVHTLADDSGLVVDALNGSPGVHSARWAEMNQAGGGDADNNALLLRQLENIPDPRRTARFVCTLALADPKGRILLTVSDTIEGRILPAPRGGGGFGYDPLFLVESHHQTTGEMAAEVKNAISHRGKAMKRMVELMGKFLVASALSRFEFRVTRYGWRSR
jgi:XTP/dITP diphosphohydrolase